MPVLRREGGTGGTGGTQRTKKTQTKPSEAAGDVEHVAVKWRLARRPEGGAALRSHTSLISLHSRLVFRHPILKAATVWSEVWFQGCGSPSDVCSCGAAGRVGPAPRPLHHRRVNVSCQAFGRHGCSCDNNVMTFYL